ncbi:uncharacterized protein LOC126678700 [Mercurialis annua]|uniref:uncharacterized protein LOC126678700 n=1 Tax=Mercurialis annua TaxID=3986 RepID=UPI00215E3063|nr:uncharacterized protein LOC126678700 [Mercurialis annua]
MTEILCRLRTDHAMICRRVCKQWNSLIQDPYFIHKNMYHAIFFNVSWRVEGALRDDGSSHSFELIAQSYGVLIERSSNARYRIRNPATKRVLNLPTPSFATMDHQITICYDCKTRMYKLVAAYSFQKETNSRGGCEILTLGDDLSWRIIEIPSLHDLDLEKEKIMFNMERPDRQNFHLMRITSNLAQVVTIRLKDEVVFVNTLPQGIFTNLDRVSNFYYLARCFDYDRNTVFPGFAAIVHRKLHYVLLEDFKENDFGRKLVMDLDFIKGKYIERDVKPLFCINYWTFFAKGEEPIIYNHHVCWREFAMEKIARSTNYIHLSQHRQILGSYSYSLLSFKGMQPED